jgi:4-nitrophenyl phosphatase
MQHIRNLIIDMDGVLWHGNRAMPGIGRCLADVQALGLNVVLASNNSTKTLAQLQAKLEHMHIDLRPEQLLTSADATINYLKRHYANAKTAYVVGEDGLFDAVARAGFSTITPETVSQIATDTPQNLPTAADFVVGGLTRNLNFELMAMAGLLVRAGVPFIATNADASFPSERGQLPGAGAVMALIEVASGVAPVVVGKPEPIIFQEALARLGADASSSAMIGDRLETDILGAQRAGLTSILVLSGVSTKADIETSGIQPDYVFADMNAVLEALKDIHTAKNSRS